jgi:hypothetical protein
MSTERAEVRTNVLPASFDGQDPLHVLDETCWCAPILTDERIYHRSKGATDGR